MDIDEVVEAIGQALLAAEGELVAEVYNQVCGHHVIYVGDGFFEEVDESAM